VSPKIAAQILTLMRFDTQFRVKHEDSSLPDAIYVDA